MEVFCYDWFYYMIKGIGGCLAGSFELVVVIFYGCYIFDILGMDIVYL